MWRHKVCAGRFCADVTSICGRSLRQTESMARVFLESFGVQRRWSRGRFVGHEQCACARSYHLVSWTQTRSVPYIQADLCCSCMNTTFSSHWTIAASPSCLKRQLNCLWKLVDLTRLRHANLFFSTLLLLLVCCRAVNWSEKAKRRRTQGTGRMRYVLCDPVSFQSYLTIENWE